MIAVETFLFLAQLVDFPPHQVSAETILSMGCYFIFFFEAGVFNVAEGVFRLKKKKKERNPSRQRQKKKKMPSGTPTRAFLEFIKPCSKLKYIKKFKNN